MHTFISRLVLIPALLGAFIAGCCPDEPGEPLIRVPKPGSGFSYTYYSTDSNGRKIDATVETVSRHVIANGVTVMGRENAVQYLEDGDTISLHYEADGDASYLQAPISYPGDEFPSMPGLPIPNITIPARWITFAFGSKVPQEIPDYDTTIMVPFNGLPVPVSIDAEGSTSYIGTEDISVSGETIATQKGLLTVNVTFTVPLLGGGNVTSIDTIWFAPKLGMFVKDVGSRRGNFPAQLGGARKLNGSFNALTGYVMK